MADPHTYAIGDVVRLKAGGPDMTVTALQIGAGTGGQQLTCQWIEKGEKVDKTFDAVRLELVAPEAA